MGNNIQKKINKTKVKSRSPFRLPNVLGKTAVWIYGLILLVPLYFVIITAFKSGAEITTDPLGLPATLHWENFANAFEEGNILQAAWNSIYTSVIGVALLMFNAVILAFCCHNLRNSKVGTILYMLILSGLFIPKVGFVTQVLLYRRLHVYDTPLALILGTAVGNIPFCVFILTGFLRTIPHELEDAARVDGCTDMKLLAHILVPVIRPALVTIGIFSFCGTWNSVTGPLLYIRSEENYTIPMTLLLNFTSTFTTKYELLFAGVLVTTIPVVIIYIFCQKYIVASLTGSVKG